MAGAFFEVILALAIAGTAVALFPVVKRQNEGVALGYVGLRTLESGIIAVGVVPLLAVVTLRQHLTGTAGADTASLVTLGNALVAFHNTSNAAGPFGLAFDYFRIEQTSAPSPSGHKLYLPAVRR